MKHQLNHKEINKRIGKTIAKYRQQSGLTQEKVAEMLELGNETVSRIERGIIMPNVMRLMELAAIFNCSASDLLGGSSPRHSDQAAYLAELLENLNDEDRNLLLGFVERFARRLKEP